MKKMIFINMNTLMKLILENKTKKHPLQDVFFDQ